MKKRREEQDERRMKEGLFHIAHHPWSVLTAGGKEYVTCGVG